MCALSLGGAGAADTRTEARFAVMALGVTVGEFFVAGRESAGRYRAEARFATTGALNTLRRVRFAMQVDGRRQGARYLPTRYSEEVRSGRRSTAASLTYAGRVPRLRGDKMGVAHTVPLDPADQTDTVDPLTALFAVLRDQPRADLCRLDQPMFDGVRRTRITLRPAGAEAGRVLCDGVFRRVAGYTADRLAEGTAFPMQIAYRGQGEVMQVETVRLSTIFGAVRLERR